MDSGKLQDARKLPAIIALPNRFALMERECVDAIAHLELETKEMITMEFGLVGIFEARRSIEMGVSMKRLSWVTFIFLPLMFVSALFGVNIDILSNNPSWRWYITCSVPFMAFVILGWMIVKYYPFAKWIKNIAKWTHDAPKWIKDNTKLYRQRRAVAAGSDEEFSGRASRQSTDLESGIRNRKTYHQEDSKMLTG